MREYPLIIATTLLFICYTGIMYGQKGYYSTDSVTYSGVEIDNCGDFSNCHYCIIRNGKNVTKKNPHEVTEYGFNNKNKFVSHSITINNQKTQVFLEKLAAGKINLYYYKGSNFKLFFIETDSSILIPLPKIDSNNTNYKEILFQFTNASKGVVEANKLLTYQKEILTAYIKRCNNEMVLPFPQQKFGVVGYLCNSELILKDNSLKATEYKIPNQNQNSFKVGGFVEIPINASDFSYHTELLFTQYHFSCLHNFSTSEIDFNVSYQSIQIPLTLQYSIPTKKLRGFFTFGVQYSRNLNIRTNLYLTDYEDDYIDFKLGAVSYPKNQMGYIFSGGIQCKLNYKRWLIVEVGLNHLYSLDLISNSQLNEYFIKTGVNF